MLMKKQLVIIGGGNYYMPREEYLESLKTKEADISWFLADLDWKDTLYKVLGPEYQVFFPTMPNAKCARYEEWEVWFERMIPYLQDGVICIGHSLGGIFLAKYLSEHILPVAVRAVILVAAPFHGPESAEPYGGFALGAHLSKIMQQSKEVHLFHSEDDSTVPCKDVYAYARVLPEAKLHVLDGRGHFTGENFPELIDLLKQV